MLIQETGFVCHWFMWNNAQFRLIDLFYLYFMKLFCLLLFELLSICFRIVMLFFSQLCKLVLRYMTCSVDIYMNKLIWHRNGIRIVSLLSKNIAFVRITAGLFEPEEWIKLEKLRRLPRKTASRQVKYYLCLQRSSFTCKHSINKIYS